MKPSALSPVEPTPPLNADTCSGERSTSRNAACTISPATDLAVRPRAYGAFGETGSDGLGGEVRAPFTFLRFKIRKHSDRFTGDVNTDSLGRPVCVADQSRHSASVEDAIKITTCRFCRIRELVRRLDVNAGIMSLLQPTSSGPPLATERLPG